MGLTLVAAAAVVLAYAVFVAWRLGLHQRLPLAFQPISLEGIPDRAARRYGDKPLFTCDRPVSWRVPALNERFTDDTSWSAARIRATAGYLATMLRERLDVRVGERIAILKQNHFDLHLLMAGIVRAGGIACPMNGSFEAAGVTPYLDNVGAKVLFTDVSTLARLVVEGARLGPVTTVVIAERATTASIEQQKDVVRHWAGVVRPAVRVLWIEEVLAAVR